MKRRTLTAAMLASPLALSLPAWAQQEEMAFIYLGSGSAAGLYYPTAVDMADIVNDAAAHMRVYVRETGASIENCEQVSAGELQMGLAQNNIVFYAYKGEDLQVFAGRAHDNLRGMAVLYPEAIQILVRKTAGIERVEDLKDKFVYVGDKGSGTQEDVKNILSAHDMGMADFRAAVRGRSGDAVNLLRDGQLDAMFYTVGVGARAVSDALATGAVELLSLSGEVVDRLTKQFPFYNGLQLAASTYPEISHETLTVTLKAMLLTSTRMSADVVERFMNLVFKQKLARFLDNPLNPNLKAYFSPETALQGMSIPLHAGAVRFYNALGIEVPEDLIA